MRPAGRPSSLLLLATLAAGVCGCGAGGGPLQTVVAAAEATLALTRTTYDVTLAGQRLVPAPTKLPGGHAAYDFTTGTGYEALLVQRPDGAPQKLYLDYLPGAVYLLPWPAPRGLLPAGKLWIAVRYPASARAPGPLAVELEGLAPELPLEEIAWGAASASFEGTREINHVPMRRYAVTVDLAKALARARTAGRSAVAAAIARERRAAPSGRARMTIFVTGPGHVGRIELTVPGSGVAAVTFQFTSFHAQFTPSPPPAARSVPVSAVAQPPSAVWALATA